MRRSRGFRSGTRNTLKIGKTIRRTITKTLNTFNIGEKVIVMHDASVQKGMPHPRHYGKTGKITEKRGISYMIAIKDGKKDKSLLSRPEHIKNI